MSTARESSRPHLNYAPPSEFRTTFMQSYGELRKLVKYGKHYLRSNEVRAYFMSK